MSMIEHEPLIEPAQRLLTAADLDAFPTDLPSGPIDYELDNGRLVFIMVPPGDSHGAFQLNIGTQLQIQGDFKGYGKARTEVGLLLWRDPDRVVGADAVFITNKSLPIRRTKEGYLETIPELVVEIRSKNDSVAYMRHKASDYLKAGVEMVWVVDPSKRNVAVYSTQSEPEIFDETNTLTLPGIIPGFAMPVADVFRE